MPPFPAISFNFNTLPSLSIVQTMPVSLSDGAKTMENRCQSCTYRVSDP